jgi:pimeloyl-ACP methyl ester carboxylesterase
MPTDGIVWDRAGEGPPLVLTHGFGDSLGTWDALWPLLSDGHSVLRWDLVGHGSSPRPESAEAYSRDVALDDLDTMIDRVGGKAVLFGHSLGGYLSLCRAVTKPEGVRALILLSTGPGYRDPVAREGWNRGVQRVAKRFDVPSAAVRLVEQHDDLVMANLDRIRVPVLLACGEDDSNFHAGLRFLENRLADARLALIPGARHHPQRTHPEKLWAAISEFLGGLPLRG